MQEVSTYYHLDGGTSYASDGHSLGMLVRKSSDSGKSAIRSAEVGVVQQNSPVSHPSVDEKGHSNTLLTCWSSGPPLLEVSAPASCLLQMLLAIVRAGMGGACRSRPLMPRGTPHQSCRRWRKKRSWMLLGDDRGRRVHGCCQHWWLREALSDLIRDVDVHVLWPLQSW